MILYDITRTVQDAPLYPGSAPAVFRRMSDVSRGDAYSLTLITADSHLGTHADAPAHFLPDGPGIDRLDPALFCGPCRVLTPDAEELIPLDALRGRAEGAERLLLHTNGHAALCEEAAEYLAGLSDLKLVGTDALSIGPEDNEAAIHRTLLGAGLAVLENLILDGVPDDDYILFAPPVKYRDCDGAPVRAILLHE